MSVVILNRAIVHYEVLGRGRPVVFLHSWIGSWSYWVSAMQAASTSYRAYALDLFGYGDTTHDPLEYSLEKQAGLLAGFLDEMGIDRVALAGHGLGALVAFRFSAQQPQRVDRIMAISSPPDSNSVSGRLQTSTPPQLADWLSDGSAEIMAALSEDVARMDARAIAASISSLRMDGRSAQPGEAGIPTLLLYGLNDPSLHVPPAGIALAAGSLVHQVDLEEAGHFPMIENASRFNRLLMDFLGLPTGSSPRTLELREEWKRRVR